MAQLTLYYRDTCPYCQKVLNFMKENQIMLPLKNILKEPASKEELLRIGGKTQVPCLVIDGKALYESDDIIAWFKTHETRDSV